MRQILENETPYGTIRNQINSNFEELYSKQGIKIFEFMKNSSTIISDVEYDEILATLDAGIPIYIRLDDVPGKSYIFPVLKADSNVLDDKGNVVLALTYSTYIDSGVDVYSEIITISTDSPHKQSYMKRALGADEKQDKIKIFEFVNRPGYTLAMSNDEYAELLQYVNTGKLAYVKITQYGEETGNVYPILQCGKDANDKYLTINYNTTVDANNDVYLGVIKISTTESSHSVAFNRIALGFSKKQDKESSELQTTDKTIVGAINEIKSSFDNKQDTVSYDLETVENTIVGAINEVYLKEKFIDENKQDKESSELLTTNKTIVGAINEVNGKVGAGDICILDVDTYNHNNDYNTIYNAVKSNKIIIIAGNETANDNTTKRYFVATSIKSSNGFELKFDYKDITYTVGDTNSNTNGIQLSKYINTFYIRNINNKIEILNKVYIAAFGEVTVLILANQLDKYTEARFNVIIINDVNIDGFTKCRIETVDKIWRTGNFIVITFYSVNKSLVGYNTYKYSKETGKLEGSTFVEIGNTVISKSSIDSGSIDSKQYQDILAAMSYKNNIVIGEKSASGKTHYIASGQQINNNIKLLYTDDEYMYIYNISLTANSDGSHTVTKETKKLAFDTST